MNCRNLASIAACAETPKHPRFSAVSLTRRARPSFADGVGSRHLTANEHWKSQIRHALYTSPRFTRAEEGEDDWRVSNCDAPAPATTVVRVYPADEPVFGPAKPRGRPRKRKPDSEAAVAGAPGPGRFVEQDTAARPGPRPGPDARAPARDAWVGPPLGLAASKASASLAKPVARVRDDDERAGNENGNENANDDENLAAFESPSKGGSSSKEEGRSPPLRRLAVSPPRRPFAAANANAPADGNLPALVPGFASPDPEGSPGRATDPKPKKRARVLSRAPGPAAAKETRASPPRAAPRLAGGPVLVMVGDKAVAPAARDRSVNRRKPLSGRRAALPHGVVPMSPPKRVVRRTSNTLSRLWETETRR